jgi:hypothetical protein
MSKFLLTTSVFADPEQNVIDAETRGSTIDTATSPSTASSPRLTNKLDDNSESASNIIPIVCPRTQCIFCLGSSELPFKARTFTFSRIDGMRRHAEKKHLMHMPSEGDVQCPHPRCDAVLEGVMHLKNHIATVHKIFL